MIAWADRLPQAALRFSAECRCRSGRAGQGLEAHISLGNEFDAGVHREWIGRFPGGLKMVSDLSESFDLQYTLDAFQSQHDPGEVIKITDVYDECPVGYFPVGSANVGLDYV